MTTRKHMRGFDIFGPCDQCPDHSKNQGQYHLQTQEQQAQKLWSTALDVWESMSRMWIVFDGMTIMTLIYINI